MKQIDLINKALLFAAVFLAGAIVLLVEILGTRVLAPFFGPTIFTWSSIIIITMSALAFAYFVGGRVIDRYPYEKTLYCFILASGFSLMIIMKINEWVLIFSDSFGLRFGPLVASGILFSIPLFLMGVASPMAVKLISKNSQKIGSYSGLVFAIGTIGSIFGALVSGFFLLPYFTLSAIFLFSGIILLILGLSGIMLAGFSKNKAIANFVLFIFLILAGVYMPAYKYNNLDFNFNIIYQKTGFYGDIKVINWEHNKCLMVDGTEESCINEESNESVVAYIREMGRIIEDRQDKSILMLGLGGGDLARYFLEDQKVDIVEIDPNIVSVAEEYFGFKKTENINIAIDDARSFLRANDKKYDLVLMDVFSSLNVPIHLLTKEYFELLENRLNENGLIAINFIGELNPPDEYTLAFINTLRSVFFSTVIADSNSNLLILANNEKSICIDKSDYFKIMQINADNADIFIDSKNSADILALPLLEKHWKCFSAKNLLFVN